MAKVQTWFPDAWDSTALCPYCGKKPWVMITDIDGRSSYYQFGCELHTIAGNQERHISDAYRSWVNEVARHG